jgi:hypothetical protein
MRGCAAPASGYIVGKQEGNRPWGLGSGFVSGHIRADGAPLDRCDNLREA